MKNCKKVLGILLVFAVVIASFPIYGGVNAAAKKASLKKKKVTVNVGETVTIQLKNKNKKNKYTYKSNKTSVATVSNKGVVKGKKDGKAKITVKETYKVKKKKKTRKIGTVTVTVKKVAPAPVEEPVVTPTPTLPAATATPTPSPTATPVTYQITHEDFTYEGLDMDRMNALQAKMEASAASGQAIKLVAFAFDDGPVAWQTTKSSTAKRIIDALVDNGQNGTFFYWGSNINSGSEEEIRYALSKGCEIGNHTYSHTDMTKMTTKKIQEDVERCRAQLEALTGLKSFLIRPPYLGANDKVKAAIKVPLISCGVDSKDWDSKNGGTLAKVLENIRKADTNKSLENSVILMHENYEFTAQAIETLVPELKAKGYEIVSVSELAYLKGITLQAGYVYNYIR